MWIVENSTSGGREQTVCLDVCLSVTRSVGQSVAEGREGKGREGKGREGFGVCRRGID